MYKCCVTLFNKKPSTPIRENCQEYVLNNLLLKKIFPLFLLNVRTIKQQVKNSCWETKSVQLWRVSLTQPLSRRISSCYLSNGLSQTTVQAKAD